jgi:ERCC4-type nuclease
MRILCDTREQKPFSFGRYPGTIVERAALQTGDYSLGGFQDRVALERKELNDLIQCLMPPNRARFERELCRARSLEYFAVLVEGSMADVRDHRYTSRMTPHSVLQSIAAFSVRYRTAFIWCGSRAGAEYMAFSLLSKFAAEIEKGTAA